MDSDTAHGVGIGGKGWGEGGGGETRKARLETYT